MIYIYHIYIYVNNQSVCHGHVKVLLNVSLTGHLLNATKLPLPGQEEGAEKEEQKGRKSRGAGCATLRHV